MAKATEKPRSTIDYQKRGAARTEEDDGSEIGPHHPGGEGIAPSWGEGVIHSDYWGFDGPAKQKEEEGRGRDGGLVVVRARGGYKVTSGYAQLKGHGRRAVTSVSPPDAFPRLKTNCSVTCTVQTKARATAEQHHLLYIKSLSQVLYTVIWRPVPISTIQRFSPS